MKSRILGLFLVLLVVYPRTAAAAKIAVLDLESDLPSEDVTVTQAVLVQEIVRYRARDQVISGDDMRTLLKVEKEKGAVDLTIDEARVSKIAGSLNADYVVSGSLKGAGGKYVLTLSLLDAKGAKVLGKATNDLRGLGTAAAPDLQSMVRGLFGARGTLQFLNQTPGASAYLGSQLLGVMPLGRVENLPPGTHEVRVLHDDYVPYVRTVEIEAGTVTRIPLAMTSFAQVQREAAQRRTWGWSLVGGGALLAGIGGWQLYEASSTSREYQDVLAQIVPSNEVEKKQSRLSSLESTARTHYSWGVGTGIAGIGVGSAGAFLLVFNPFQDQLERVSALPSWQLGPDRLVATWTFGGAR